MGYFIVGIVALAIGYGAGKYEDLWMPKLSAAITKLWAKLIAFDKKRK